MNFPAVYLASRSPRRRELLGQMTVDFAVIAPDVDESVRPGEKPADYVMRIAMAKAKAGRAMLSAGKNNKPVLAADTAVIIDEQILGKPVDDGDARNMLKRLSGKTHQVMTAVALASSTQLLTDLSVSEVRFAKLSEAEIDWYIQTGEGRDKAGSYAVQGLGALFIDQIQGSYSGIMGLPIRETGQLLMQLKSQ
jgi:nucleoside triphosphate pyrophosphatase